VLRRAPKKESLSKARLDLRNRLRSSLMKSESSRMRSRSSRWKDNTLLSKVPLLNKRLLQIFLSQLTQRKQLEIVTVDIHSNSSSLKESLKTLVLKRLRRKRLPRLFTRSLPTSRTKKK
jgi:hypothetical protein